MQKSLLALCLVLVCVSAHGNTDIYEADILQFGVSDVPQFIGGMVFGILKVNHMDEI